VIVETLSRYSPKLGGQTASRPGNICNYEENGHAILGKKVCNFGEKPLAKNNWEV
jgi:hypothetical protein